MSVRGWMIGTGTIAATVLLMAALVPHATGQQFVQYGFESRDTIWQAGERDAEFPKPLHKLTDETAHSGQRCETIQGTAGQGTFIYYTYSPGRAAVSEELSVSVWVKANRPGVSLRCKAVLPRERNPRNLDQPLEVILEGETYSLVNRWQQLSLRQPLKRLREQQQLLAAERKTDVIVADAYIDQILLNVYGGPGRTEVFTDDLEVGPLTENRTAQPQPIAGTPGRTVGNPAPLKQDEVSVRGSPARMLVGGERFYIRGIRHSGTPIKTLQEAGFNTLWLDESAPAGLIDDAVRRGFWIVPMLGRGHTIDRPGTPVVVPEQLGPTVRRFLERGGVLGWDLGTNLTEEHYGSVARTAQLLRTVDPTRPLIADVMDGYRRYSANLDQFLLGVHRWPLGTTLQLPEYRDWLRQRKNLGLPGHFCWTWIQSHLPDWFIDQAYDGKPVQGEPIGPQAEQIRLLTYTAIASGYHGVAYWSDRFMADPVSGRDTLLTLALLNLELRLLEPLLLQAEDPLWIDTPVPQVKAAILRTPKATVVLPVWLGDNAQVVPGQSAVPSLTLTIPLATGSQVWEVSPGHIRSLRWDRVPGGLTVTIPEFSLTSILVVTSDLADRGVVVTLQEQVRTLAPWAAQWAHDQAREELVKVEAVQTELEKFGLPLPDATALFQKCRQFLDSSLARRRNGDFAEAYLEAQRALRPLRILMRTQWDRCMKEVDTPVASPYLLSFFTLPRHLRFMDEIRQSQVSQNQLTDGGFETVTDQAPPGWAVQETQHLDNVTTVVRRVQGSAKEGQQCLVLNAMPREEKLVPRALERTFVSLRSPAVKLPPGTLVRISAWVQIPGSIKASVDGAMFYDSIGGEPLAVRMTAPTGGWKKVTVFRRVPATGSVHVVMALTGLGTAFFDDVRIEPLTPTIQQAGYRR